MLYEFGIRKIIKQAIDEGRGISLYVKGDFYSGVPTRLTWTRLELWCYNDGAAGTWWVRLSSIDSICPCLTSWSDEQFQDLPGMPGAAEFDDDDDSEDGGELVTA